MVSHEQDVAEHCERIIRIGDAVVEASEVVAARRAAALSPIEALRYE